MERSSEISRGISRCEDQRTLLSLKTMYTQAGVSRQVFSRGTALPHLRKGVPLPAIQQLWLIKERSVDVLTLTRSPNRCTHSLPPPDTEWYTKNCLYMQDLPLRFRRHKCKRELLSQCMERDNLVGNRQNPLSQSMPKEWVSEKKPRCSKGHLELIYLSQ